MKFINPLPFVQDIGKSVAFYRDVLQLNVVEDHGNFVQFENGFALHDGASLYRTIFGKNPDETGPYGRTNLVLYFEVEDLNAVYARIKPQVDLVHPILQQSWGQRVFRFYDPDRHLIEVGEPYLPDTI
ncbi:MAG: VOC family protein [Roseibium sp.]|uniref:VOC family protein n=1 Tax=Roseibium sp. TaxID=1936156 RepID=UPI00262BAE17|nr:VOC family protein [Roseibium sp.]MCV0427602.1 VOC family protein [Roseibium sp.]